HGGLEQLERLCGGYASLVAAQAASLNSGPVAPKTRKARPGPSLLRVPTGAGEAIRTPDPHLGNLAAAHGAENKKGPAGAEPSSCSDWSGRGDSNARPSPWQSGGGPWRRKQERPGRGR